MEDLKQIQEFFSKPLEETTFKVGQKVTYLGHPAVITATKEYNGKNYVSVSYDKGKGKTKTSDILTTDGSIKPLKEGGKWGYQEAAKKEDKIDIVTMDVPLFIRALEYAKEDAQEDMDLHDFAERAIAATKEQGILQMDDYDMLVGGKEPMDEANKEDKKLTLNDFVQMVRDDMMAGSSPDEKPSDEQVRKKAKAYYNDYLKGASVDDLFEASKEEETEFHTKLDKLVHDTFGKRKGEMEEVKGVPVEKTPSTITRKEWDKTPKKVKAIINGIAYVERYDRVIGTYMAPIKIVDEIEETELTEASKGALNYFNDLKYYYQKAFRYLDVEEREEYKQLAKDFFSNLQEENDQLTEVTLKKGDIVNFADGKKFYIIGPKGDGYEFTTDNNQRAFQLKKWFDMMISKGEATLESVKEAKMPEPRKDEYYFSVRNSDAKDVWKMADYEFGNDIDRGRIEVLFQKNKYVIKDFELAKRFYQYLRDRGVKFFDQNFVSESVEVTESYVPSNIAEFAKRRGVSSLVRKVAGWAEKVGARITGGTAIGKGYNTLILDMGYQTADIRIDVEDETIELYDEPIYSFNDFKRVFMEEETRKQIEHDEETLRREQGLEENQTESKFKKGDKITYYGNKGVVNSAKYNTFAKDWDYTISYIEDGTRKGESGVRDKELKSSPINKASKFGEQGLEEKSLNEKMLVPTDKIDRMARDIAAKYFSSKTDKKDAIEILKQAIKDSYRALDPEVEIREEEGYSQFLKDDPEHPGGKTKGLTPDVMNKILMRVVQDIEESRPGLWDNIRAKRERGETPSRKGSKAYKSAVKAGKEINKAKD